MAMEHRTGIEGVGTTNVILALAVLVAPFLTGDGGNVLASNVLTGILIGALAGFNIYAARRRHTERAYVPAMLNIVLGLWVLASGWLFALTSMALAATNTVLGVLLVGLAAYNTWAAHDARVRHPTA